MKEAKNIAIKLENSLDKGDLKKSISLLKKLGVLTTSITNKSNEKSPNESTDNEKIFDRLKTDLNDTPIHLSREAMVTLLLIKEAVDNYAYKLNNTYMRLFKETTPYKNVDAVKWQMRAHKSYKVFISLGVNCLSKIVANEKITTPRKKHNLEEVEAIIQKLMQENNKPITEYFETTLRKKLDIIPKKNTGNFSETTQSDKYPNYALYFSNENSMNILMQEIVGSSDWKKTINNKMSPEVFALQAHCLLDKYREDMAKNIPFPKKEISELTNKLGKGKLRPELTRKLNIAIIRAKILEIQQTTKEDIKSYYDKLFECTNKNFEFFIGSEVARDTILDAVYEFPPILEDNSNIEPIESLGQEEEEDDLEDNNTVRYHDSDHSEELCAFFVGASDSNYMKNLGDDEKNYLRTPENRKHCRKLLYKNLEKEEEEDKEEENEKKWKEMICEFEDDNLAHIRYSYENEGESTFFSEIKYQFNRFTRWLGWTTPNEPQRSDKENRNKGEEEIAPISAFEEEEVRERRLSNSSISSISSTDSCDSNLSDSIKIDQYLLEKTGKKKAIFQIISDQRDDKRVETIEVTIPEDEKKYYDGYENE